jgi:hypothetical protein
MSCTWWTRCCIVLEKMHRLLVRAFRLRQEDRRPQHWTSEASQVNKLLERPLRNLKHRQIFCWERKTLACRTLDYEDEFEGPRCGLWPAVSELPMPYNWSRSLIYLARLLFAPVKLMLLLSLSYISIFFRSMFESQMLTHGWIVPACIRAANLSNNEQTWTKSFHEGHSWPYTCVKIKS